MAEETAKAKPRRKKSAKTEAAERVGELFGDPTPEAKRTARKDRRAKQAAAVVEETERLLALSRSSSQEPDAAAAEDRAAAYEAEPSRVTTCEECSAPLPYGGHVATPLCDACLSKPADPAEVEAAYERGREAAVTRQVGSARVLFHEVRTARLEQINYDDFGDYEPGAETFGVSKSRVDGAFVKVSAALRPSEREAFDGQALKEKLRLAGARAVLLAVHPVAELPGQEAREEVSAAARPEEAIAAWFADLPVPEEDRAAARELALEILQAEGG